MVWLLTQEEYIRQYANAAEKELRGYAAGGLTTPMMLIVWSVPHSGEFRAFLQQQ